MMNKFILIFCISLFLIPITCLAERPEDYTPSYKGVLKIKSSKVLDGDSYESTKANKNTILVSKGDSTLTNFTINKAGDGDNEEADFYGINAGVLVKGGSLNISKSNITTNGSYANGVFSYDKGVINISDSKITTFKNNSGGIMVAGGGTIYASNCTVKTSGNSSAAIRSDRGGGSISVKGGTYESNGQGSPSVYSTADINIEDASLSSTSAEGVVVEGANSVSLKNSRLDDNNVTLNGNSETYKNIFLYQSMSGDSDKGKASFTSDSSTINTKNGDTIFVTNTRAEINLINNTITNTSGNFLRAEKGKWGEKGLNGGIVTLTLDNQKVEGSIVIDKISSLTMNMKNKSFIKGAINTKNEAKSLKIVLSSDSNIVLTGDTYLTELNNEKADNSNIYLNGYSLYVNGEKKNGNTSEYKEINEIDSDSLEETNINTNDSDSNKNIEYLKNHFPLLGALFCLFILLLTVGLTVIKRRKA